LHFLSLLHQSCDITFHSDFLMVLKVRKAP